MTLNQLLRKMEGKHHDAKPRYSRKRFKPIDCPHCEYDRRFPGFETGGWMQQDNNGPIVSCPVCNDDEAQPRA